MKYLLNILVKIGVIFTLLLGGLKIIGASSQSWFNVFMPLIAVIVIKILYSLLQKIVKIN